MNNVNANSYEAYVINDDGTKSAMPVTFMSNGRAYAAPQSPFAQAGGQAAVPARGLHLGRRLAGLAIAAVGVPMLILPGPGLALIALGLMMVIKP